MPGFPCCCEGCIWIQDPFLTDTSANYNQVLGAWTWNTGGLGTVSTSANNGRLINKTANPAGNSHMIGTSWFELPSNNMGAGVMISSDLANQNYLYGLFRRLTGGNRTLKIFQVVGNVATQLGHTVVGFASGDRHRMILCYDGAEVTCTVPTLIGVDPADMQIAAPLVGWNSAYQYAGLRTDSNSGQTVHFDDLQVTKHQVDDGTCDDCQLQCPTCTGEARSTMQLSVTGLTNAPGSQCICNQFNGTYIVKRQQDFGGIPDGPCFSDRNPPFLTCFWAGDWIPISQPYCSYFRYRAIVKFQRSQDPFLGQTEYAILARLVAEDVAGEWTLAEAYFTMPDPQDPVPCEHNGRVLTPCFDTFDCANVQNSTWTLTSL